MILSFVKISISEAIFKLSRAISSAVKLASPNLRSPLAAAKAKLPPEPIVRIPSSGSMTSPVPETSSTCSLFMTINIASNFCKPRSLLHCFAISIAARCRFPLNCLSLSSNISSRVIASATPPANPTST